MVPDVDPNVDPDVDRVADPDADPHLDPTTLPRTFKTMLEQLSRDCNAGLVIFSLANGKVG